MRGVWYWNAVQGGGHCRSYSCAVHYHGDHRLSQEFRAEAILLLTWRWERQGLPLKQDPSGGSGLHLPRALACVVTLGLPTPMLDSCQNVNM
jgi:hypothetical protein